MCRSASRPVRKNQRPSLAQYEFINGAWLAERDSARDTLPKVACRLMSQPST